MYVCVCVCMHAYMLSCFSCVLLFAILWTVAYQAPLPWDFPGKNTGVGCCALLQGIFLTQGPNLSLVSLLHWLADSLPLRHLRSSIMRLNEFALLCCAQSLQSCPTLCSPTDCSPPGSSAHRILQARTLEWVAVPFPRGSS